VYLQFPPEHSLLTNHYEYFVKFTYSLQPIKFTMGTSFLVHSVLIN